MTAASRTGFCHEGIDIIWRILESMSTDRPGLALITGASSGIGREFALQLGREGCDLIVAGRRRERLQDLVERLPEVAVRPLVGDLGAQGGLAAIVAACAGEPLDLLVNNAGVSHYMSFLDLPPEKLTEVLQVKVVAPTSLAHAAAPGMVARGGGAIVNVAGMLAFGGAAPLGPAPGRAADVSTLADLVAFSQALHEEFGARGLRVQALCPGIVATEFHERQGMDLSAFPRMSAHEVVAASLKGLRLEEVVCAPGVPRRQLLDDVFAANLAAFGEQSPELAPRYR
ncbi:MAG: SDR family NAD(P)-dependent oxidoreductase [Caulobacteraceae bacterium]|nr:SDR family NAD(P)-dependent oxidoreductase [Caulobacteraceae bacterium]